MADKKISQLVDRGTVANNDVVAIVASGAASTNKATISSIQTFMQGNLDLGVTSVGITLGSSGTDVSVTGSPITTSGNITINIPDASATARGVVNTNAQTFAGAKTFVSDIVANGVNVGKGAGTGVDNVRVGANTLIANTTGANNTAVGARSLQTNSTGQNNTAVGLNSLQSNAGGSNNTSVGLGSLNFNTSGSNNVAVGTDAGKLTSTSSTLLIANNSIFIGEDTRANASNETNQIVIGDSAVGQGSNTVTIGNASITSNKFFGRVIHADAVNADESATLGQLITTLGGFVTLNTAQTITGSKTFNSRIIGQGATLTGSGSPPTLDIFHTSGSGIALDITKAGNNEALRVAKTSGSGNAVTITGGLLSAEAATLSGALNGTSAVFSGNVSSNDGISTALMQNVNSAPRIVLIDGRVNGKRFDLGSEASGAGTFSITDNTAGQIRLTIASTGNVGIGTTAPTARLDIAQAMSDGSTSAFTNPHLALTATSATNFTGFVGMTFATSDSVNFGFSYGALRSEAGLGDLVWRNHFNSAQGTERMRLTAAGRLLIGTTTESTFALDVNGTARVGALNGTSASFTGQVQINNGQFFNAKRADGAGINILGFESGTNDLISVTAGSFKLRNTGGGDAANLFSVSPAGAATFSSTITTAAPTGSTAQPFKVGSVTTTANTFFGTIVKMEINGVVYDVMIATPPL